MTGVVDDAHLETTRLEASHNGTTLPLATSADDIIAAGFDLEEQVVPVPEWGFSVKVRTPNAEAVSRVKAAGVKMIGQKVVTDMGAAEAMQFRLGVIEPKFTEMQVLQLRQKSGPGFKRVIDVLDKMGGLGDKEELLAQREFHAEPRDD